MSRPSKQVMREDIVRLYRAGWSLADIGRRLDLSPAAIAYHMDVAGEPRRGLHERLPNKPYAKQARRRWLADRERVS